MVQETVSLQAAHEEFANMLVFQFTHIHELCVLSLDFNHREQCPLLQMKELQSGKG